MMLRGCDVDKLDLAVIALIALITFSTVLILTGRYIVSQLMAHIAKIEKERDNYRSEAEAYKLEMETCFQDSRGKTGEV